MSPTVYLVSGANRGLGLALVAQLAKRDDTVVFAGVRNLNTATELQSLARSHPTNVHVLHLVSGDVKGNEAAISEIKAKVGRLDVVIANAGVGKWYGPALEAPVEEFNDHFEINVVGTFVLFRASYELLKASTPSPKFIPISSGAGSVEVGPALGAEFAPYGVSKAALNYLTRKLHFEYEKDGLVVFPLCPGSVATDMESFSREKDEIIKTFPKSRSPEEAAALIVTRVDEATRESSGGQFVREDGTRWPW